MGRENSGQTERSPVSRRSGDWTSPLMAKEALSRPRHLGGLVDCIEGACGREVPRSAERAPQDDKDGEGKLGTGETFSGFSKEWRLVRPHSWQKRH